jgi:hypothetical protein
LPFARSVAVWAWVGEPVWIASELVRQNLDRHVSSEPRVFRFVKLSHPARAEGSENLVGAEADTGRKAQWDSPVEGILSLPSERRLAAATRPEKAFQNAEIGV